MAVSSKTWWGKTFVAALESFTDSGRLSRGRAYSSDRRLKTFEIKDGLAQATVRGNVNPYFGVYKEPTYITTIKLKAVSRAQWSKVIAEIAGKASFISKLLLNEIPDNIEDCFKPLGLNLLPKVRKDCVSSCSCPDWGDPCKHVAGVYYRVAAELDRDPFLLFELRGISREDLRSELERSTLGKALSQELGTQGQLSDPVTSLYTRPERQDLPEEVTLRDFWHGKKNQPAILPTSSSARVPAILIKKQGDFPPFWHRDQSFIAVMEEFYERVKSKNRDVFES